MDSKGLVGRWKDMLSKTGNGLVKLWDLGIERLGLGKKYRTRKFKKLNVNINVKRPEGANK